MLLSRFSLYVETRRYLACYLYRRNFSVSHFFISRKFGWGSGKLGSDIVFKLSVGGQVSSLIAQRKSLKGIEFSESGNSNIGELEAGNSKRETRSGERDICLTISLDSILSRFLHSCFLWFRWQCLRGVHFNPFSTFASVLLRTNIKMMVTPHFVISVEGMWKFGKLIFA